MIMFMAAGFFPLAVTARQDTLSAYSAASRFWCLPGKCISIVKSSYEKPNLSFLVLHDDENTGLEAAHDFCSKNGGAIVELQYGSERNISFGNGRIKFAFDPNQIFNNAGVQKTLKKYSHQLPRPEAIKQVRGLALAVLENYQADSLGYFVTLHNNSEGRFNILSYLRDPKFDGVADSVFINSAMDADDFVLVTEPGFFSYLKRSAVNVVLQSPAATDGSLSVYAQRNGIPYVNIEVQDGHYDEHFRLIGLVADMLSELKNKELYVAK